MEIDHAEYKKIVDSVGILSEGKNRKAVLFEVIKYWYSRQNTDTNKLILIMYQSGLGIYADALENGQFGTREQRKSQESIAAETFSVLTLEYLEEVADLIIAHEEFNKDKFIAEIGIPQAKVPNIASDNSAFFVGILIWWRDHLAKDADEETSRADLLEVLRKSTDDYIDVVIKSYDWSKVHPFFVYSILELTKDEEANFFFRKFKKTAKTGISTNHKLLVYWWNTGAQIVDRKAKAKRKLKVLQDYLDNPNNKLTPSNLQSLLQGFTNEEAQKLWKSLKLSTAKRREILRKNQTESGSDKALSLAIAWLFKQRIERQDHVSEKYLKFQKAIFKSRPVKNIRLDLEVVLTDRDAIVSQNINLTNEDSAQSPKKIKKFAEKFLKKLHMWLEGFGTVNGTVLSYEVFDADTGNRLLERLYEFDRKRRQAGVSSLRFRLIMEFQTTDSVQELKTKVVSALKEGTGGDLEFGDFRLKQDSINIKAG